MYLLGMSDCALFEGKTTNDSVFFIHTEQTWSI